MRKITMYVLVLLMALILVACSQSEVPQKGAKGPEMEGAILTAKIMDIEDTSLLLIKVGEDAKFGDIFRIGTGNVDIISESGTGADTAALKSGMLIEVAYNGLIQESSPMGLGGVKAITIKEQAEDIVGLYKKVIDDLYNTDPGLNSEINILAFDLTKVSNITEAEKSALIYMVGNQSGLATIMSTFEELTDQGYIDKEKLYFEDGLLFSIEDTAIAGNKFTFNAQKWRSGLGAYFFHECTAKKSKTSWDYTVGAHMIS
ncbi:MAG: hypothetical protein WDA53_04180 [Bacillota bacterium]